MERNNIPFTESSEIRDMMKRISGIWVQQIIGHRACRNAVLRQGTKESIRNGQKLK